MYFFKVKGSTGVYEVTVDKEGNNLICKCTCSAAKNGMACKHRFEILSGKAGAVISDNKGDVPMVPDYICDTEDGQLLLNYIVMEAEFDRLKREIPLVKKQLGRILPI